MVIFLAGLQNIPLELYEAAEGDGAAGRGGVHARELLPLLWPTVAVNILGLRDEFPFLVPDNPGYDGGERATVRRSP